MASNGIRGKSAAGPLRSKGKMRGDAGGFAAFRDRFLQSLGSDEAAAFAPGALDRATETAFAAFGAHREGSTVIDIATERDALHDGRTVSLITLVNDNMPFLLDSVLGEMAESFQELHLVRHPVFMVRRNRAGRAEVVSAGDAGGKVSVIQVVVRAMHGDEAKALETRLHAIMKQVRAAVAGWRAMLDRLDRAIFDFRTSPPPLERARIDETIEFLKWLRDDNFTFLGMRDYRFVASGKGGELRRAPSPGLGILADPDVSVLRRGGEALTTTPQILAFLTGPDPIIVTKANVKSLVHRRTYMDYVGIKTFDAKGRLTGELRIVGLFTSTAYTRSVASIPFLRAKADQVIRQSGFAPADHSGKALINVLESYPRDELFQIDIETLLRNAVAILALGERPRLRVLPRIDRFDRFVSVIVYVPRDRYDSRVREAIGAYLKDAYEGRLSAYYPSFPEGNLARVHFIVGRSGGKTPRPGEADLESAIREIVRTWSDRYAEAAAHADDAPALLAFAGAFPESYRGTFAPNEAIADARRILALSQANRIAVHFYRPGDASAHAAGLRIYHHGAAVSLSERVPLLENLGFRVVSERTYELAHAGAAVSIHDMELESRDGVAIDWSDGGALFADAFLAIWSDAVDNDSYNRIVSAARLDAHAVMVLRAYGRYLQQAGVPYSQDFIAGALERYPGIARDLHALYCARLDPKRAQDGKPAADAAALTKRIMSALDDVPSLDDDRILRRLLNLVEATLRSNGWAKPVKAKTPFVLALKLDPRRVEGLPSPRPWREIFVYGTQVEGVHLRYGPVARGGLRWSDRAHDYRTEVLGLVKAQQVKNAVIVPVGAKGGFYPKRLPQGGGRDDIFNAGRAAYITFVASLLSLTDNLDGKRVVPPPGVVRHDGDDPYFVVAADKGTATFSDTANAISGDFGFWLDDAFASGGSAGYDHKKMGITARGAWEAVKRHFREIDVDIQKTPFTVAGVGDMSGDVFGNGMLLSKAIRLVAAFDHRDIFIDPDPDTEKSFAERQRLFNLPRSSWQDYDPSKISKGGGVFARSAKSVKLSAEAQAALDLKQAQATPQEIMTAILRAPVDLLWFGGIGTYVRATTETDAEAGDRANDAIRVTAQDLRAKVIGEGANLGVTQKARIQYAAAGGRCNSDAIDNSAGVNSSDVEVNIKIALSGAMRAGRLERKARDRLLAAMTDDVARLVLANNYQQTLALSVTQMQGAGALSHQARFMSMLEKAGMLDRKVESLPADSAMNERIARGDTLTRPELAVLLAYAKIVLFADLAKGELVRDPHLDADLMAYFPAPMAKSYGKDLAAHRLRNEIVATVLANDAVNRGGPTFVSRLQDLTGAPAEAAVRAFVTIRDGYELNAIYRDIDALDTKVPGEAQNRMHAIVAALLRRTAAWQVKYAPSSGPVASGVSALRAARHALEPGLLALLPESIADDVRTDAAVLRAAGAPQGLAARLALLPVAGLIPEIAAVAQDSRAPLAKAASAFFDVTGLFRIGRMEEAADGIVVKDYYDGLALLRARDMIADARRAIAGAVLRQHGGSKNPAKAWEEASSQRIERVRQRIEALTEGTETTLSRLTVAAGLLGDLAQA